MRKVIIGCIFAMIAFAFMFITNDMQNQLFAQGSNTPTAYTGDPVPADKKQITLTFKEERDREINGLQVKVNGAEINYSADEFNNGILTLTVSKTEKTIIDFSANGFYFEPGYVIVNENGLDTNLNYDVKAYLGNDSSDLVKTKTYDVKGDAKNTFENNEEAYLSMEATRPMTVIFYKLQNDNKVYIYDAPIKLKAGSDREHRMDVVYTAIRYYPGEDKPTIDYDFSNTSWVSTSVKFNAKTEVPITPDPTKPTFKDENGNVYEEKDVKLDIQELSSNNPIRILMTAFAKKEGLLENQLLYYDISLKVGNTKVQPNEKYSFVIPYAEGTSKYHDFMIYHIKNNNIKEAETLSYTAENDGLHVTVDSFSPFIIGWKEKVVTPPSSDPVPDSTSNSNGSGENGGVNTGDTSTMNFMLVAFVVSSLAISLSVSKKYKREDH